MILFEPQCIGFMHSEINASYIGIYSKAFPNDELFFIGESNHTRLACQHLSAQGIELKQIGVDVPRVGQSIIEKFFTEFINSLRTFRLAKEKKHCVLVLSSTSVALLFVKILSIIMRVRSFVVLHGILETIQTKPNSVLRRVLWFRYYLYYLNSRWVTTIANNVYIMSNITRMRPQLSRYVANIDLPYIFDESELSSRSNLRELVVFSSAGVGAVAKGTHHFFALASDVMRNSADANVQFRYIGHFVDDSMNDFVNEYVHVTSKDKPLTNQEFVAQLRNTSFLVFFYPSDSYKLCVSGVFLDAMNYEKPIIALENDSFRYYFKKYGDLGWLCKNYEEILNVVLRLSKNPNSPEVTNIIGNIRAMKRDFSTDAQVERMRAVLGS